MKRKCLFVFIFVPLWSMATHITGGTMNLKWVGRNTYVLSVKLFRDCKWGYNNDSNIVVGLFEKGTDSLVSSIPIAFNNNQVDTITNPLKCQYLYGVCSQYINNYATIITLESTIYNHAAGYYFSWQRCCRLGGITNLVNSREAGLCLYLEVPNLSLIKNSSPMLRNKAALLIPNGLAFKHNFDFFDEDKDSLRYSLVTPLNGLLDVNVPTSTQPKAGPYPNVVLANGYSTNNFIGGKEPLTIDSITGEIIGMPGKTGSFLVGILVEELRNGQKIGKTRLDFQINVIASSKSVPEIVLTHSDGSVALGDTLTLTETDSFFFSILGSTQYDSIYLELSLPDSVLNRFQTKPIFQLLKGANLRVESQFSWQTHCGMADSSNAIPLMIKAFDTDCPFPKTTTKTIWLKFSSQPKLTGPHEVCVGAKGVTFSLPNNLASKTYTWELHPQIKGYSTSHQIVTDFENFPFAGTISVSGKNACGANFLLNHLVYVVSKPQTPTITLWGLSLHSSIELGNQWFRNDSLILGSTKKYHELKTNGKYYTIINWFGCKSDPSEPYEVTFMGLDNEVSKPWLQVYPNPFSQQLTLTHTSNEVGSMYVILNSLGQKMEEGELTEALQINTENYPAGLYLFKVLSLKSSYILRLIKH